METLKEIAKQIRRQILLTAYRAKSHHVGPSLSIVDILTVLYFKILNIDPNRPDAEDRDRFILSKAHGAMALYAVLAERGILDKQILKGYYQNNGTLPAHLDRFTAPGVEVSAGSLGHGLAMAVGMAYGLKLKRQNNRVFVLL